MQQLGCLYLDDEKVLVLVRSNGTLGRDLKLRKSGKDGVYLKDEEAYLNEHPELASDLRNGKVITL